MERRQPRSPIIGFASRIPSTACSSSSFLCSSSGLSPCTPQFRHLDQQLVVRRQELVQRRVDQADGDRLARHHLEDALEVLLLEWAAGGPARSAASPRPWPGSSPGRWAGDPARRTCAPCGTARCPPRPVRSPAWRRAGCRRSCGPAASGSSSAQAISSLKCAAHFRRDQLQRAQVDVRRSSRPS